MKIDLHNHLLIGFQPEWLRLQGYKNHNLAKILADSAMEKDIRLVAIISENFEIPLSSIHDRFTRICEDAEKINEPSYAIKKIGKNTLKINTVYIVNGQTVIVNENGRRYDHLVIGSNQVPNNCSFDYTLNYCADEELLNFLEHPAVENHFGTGIHSAERLIGKYGQLITGVEGHNGSLIWNPNLNQKAKELATRLGIPHIATSDAHSPNQTGAATIETEDNPQFSSEIGLFSYLNRVIKEKKYICNEGYVSTSSWIINAARFAIGTKVFGIGKR